MFEAHIESKTFLQLIPFAEIIEQCGVSVEAFFDALKEMQEQTSESDFYVQVLLSITDYQNFIDMIKHFKAEHPKPMAF